MEALTYPHKIVLLTTGFQDPAHRLLFARARLYFDRIELSGWRYTRRYAEQIPLDAITRVEWMDDAPRARLILLHLTEERQRCLRLQQPWHWQQALERRLAWNHDGHPAPILGRQQALTLTELALLSSSIS